MARSAKLDAFTQLPNRTLVLDRLRLAIAEHQWRSFDDVEPALAEEWSASSGTSRMDWDRARNASRDAWGR